jgi:hypothetical protein
MVLVEPIAKLLSPFFKVSKSSVIVTLLSPPA